jgi:hypothetical protein
VDIDGKIKQDLKMEKVIIKEWIIWWESQTVERWN